MCDLDECPILFSMDLHQTASAEVAKWWARAQIAYPATRTHGVPIVKINRRLKTTLGRAHLVDHMIDFSESLMLNHMGIYVSDIFAHEVAHMVTYYNHPKAKQFHGKEWKSVMHYFGKEPKLSYEL